MNWWAVKVYQNRVFMLEEQLHELGITTFIPLEHSETKSATKKKNAVSGLLFFRAPKEQLSELQKNATTSFSFYTSPPDEAGHRVPAPISDAEMQRFIIIATAALTGIDYISPEQLNTFTPGRRVRVTGGIFQGAEGEIKRIKGNRRLVVEIKGVCAVATPYIPAALLEPIIN